MKNILIRADSSSTMGTGHIMRDLVLAQQFTNDNIIFATQNLPGNINYKIKEDNYQIEILNSNELSELIEVINKHHINKVIIDHYGIDAQYEKALKEQTGVEMFVLDDTYEEHNCDVLLNHNIYAQKIKYKDLVPQNCELRCGTKYTLLRDEFRQAKMKSVENDKLLNVFVAMGGADSANLNIKILKVLEGFPNFLVHVVTTNANQFLDELQTYIKDKNNIKLYVNTDQIAYLMRRSDFAIVTPSVTLNEIVYMALPFIAIQTASNQSEMVEYLIENNDTVLKTFDSDKLKIGLEDLIAKKDTKLTNFIHLSDSQKKMVLNWRNDDNIRKWMLTQDEIGVEKHFAYIDSLASREDRIYFLVEKEEEEIGVIDFTNIDLIHSTVECGLYAKPGKKGVGRIFMALIKDYAFRILKMETLIAEVLDGNKTAIGLYHKYGFQETERRVGKRVIIHMELENENR